MSGNSLGVLPGEVKPGVREIHLCKDERGKTGLRLRAIDKVGLGVGGGEEGPRGGRRASPRAGQRLPAARVARPPPRASGVLAASSTSGRGGRAGSPSHSKEGAARAGSRGPPDP